MENMNILHPLLLNAIKNALLSDIEIDLTNIVDDLSTSEEDRDINTILLALALKCAKIDEQSPRYFLRDDETFYRYCFVGYSCILDQVKVLRDVGHIDNHGDAVFNGIPDVIVLPALDWLNYPTNVAELFEEE